MSRLEAGSGNEPIEFFIFDSIAKIFFHIYEKADWKIAQLPYGQLQAQVNTTYTACDAIRAEYPHYPTPQQIDNMTGALRWGQEMVSDPPKYQLELYFDPKYQNSSFISCFNEKITNWINDHNQSQNEHDYRFLFGILVAVAVVGIVCCVGFAFYQKYQDQQHINKITSGSLGGFFSRNRQNAPPDPRHENAALLGSSDSLGEGSPPSSRTSSIEMLPVDDAHPHHSV